MNSISLSIPVAESMVLEPVLQCPPSQRQLCGKCLATSLSSNAQTLARISSTEESTLFKW